jgi:predicted dehydrogenase
MYAICRRSKESLVAIGDAFGVEKRYTRFQDVLSDPAVDFVHINTPLGTHGALSIAALKAGKHVMCTVPMALSVEECEEIVRLVRVTGLKYMMAETVLYSREYLFIRQLYKQGKLGDLQFLQGSHHQDMEGWPGLPPMYYATHCISPCLAIADAEAEYVSCIGSGRIGSELRAKWGSPFAVESAHIWFRNSDLAARVYRSLFATARQYRESFDVFGTLRSVEWPLIEGTGLVVHAAKMPLDETTEIARAPDYPHLLPEPVRHFTTKTFLDRRSTGTSERIAELILMARIRISSPTRAPSKVTVGLIPIWCTSSCRPSSRIEIRSPMRSSPQT